MSSRNLFACLMGTIFLSVLTTLADSRPSASELQLYWPKVVIDLSFAVATGCAIFCSIFKISVFFRRSPRFSAAWFLMISLCAIGAPAALAASWIFFKASHFDLKHLHFNSDARSSSRENIRIDITPLPNMKFLKPDVRKRSDQPSGTVPKRGRASEPVDRPKNELGN